MEPLPDLSELDNQGLKDLMHRYEAEEREISYQRRILHGKIDILRVELTRRLRDTHARGDKLFSMDDVGRLAEILSGRGVANEPGEGDQQGRGGA
jgi:hypothetical protein